ncbi:hypothetical protein NA78x_003157 [Anatilimnocola sp. NA78]|uniref:hypothetical protein n=1 Tax=Anatilimnocola sp. NA78 TaxID=3415683 RepID=UPI003CE45A15
MSSATSQADSEETFAPLFRACSADGLNRAKGGYQTVIGKPWAGDLFSLQVIEMKLVAANWNIEVFAQEVIKTGISRRVEQDCSASLLDGRLAVANW